MRVEWHERSVPLAASAAWVPRGRVGHLIDRLAAFRGVGTSSGLVLLAPELDLPWVGDIRYFGVDPAVPSLLLPTTRVPTAPLELVERAFRRVLSGPGPWLVDDVHRTVVPLHRVGRIDRARVKAWLGSSE